jgi:hypothetical protein
MKRNLIKIGFVAASFFAFVLIMNSCKKTGLGETGQVNPKEDLAFLAKIKSDIETNGLTQRVEVNQKIKPVFVDVNGNEGIPPTSQSIISTCGGDAPGIADLVYYEKGYQCNQGYSIKWFYNISWNNNIVPIGTNGILKTKGTVRVSLPGNANAYNNTTFNVEILDLGLNPDQSTYPGENIFSVSFTTTTIIPESVLNAPGAILRLGAVFASDCPTLENWALALGNAYGPNGTVVLSSSPCQRNERLFIQYPNDVPGRKLKFAGFDPLSLCSYLYSCDRRYPDYQEVQYRIDGGAWTNASNTATFPTWITGTSFLTRINTSSYSQAISPGIHNIEVRTRNWQYNVCQTNPYPLPTTTNSCANTAWSVYTLNNYLVN